jgi:hypothetical protein
MLLILPFLLVLGLFLPGYLMAKYLRHTLPWASAFLFSLLILFHGVFWLGILHVSLTVWSVAAWLIVVCAGAGWLAKRSAEPEKAEIAKPWDRQDRILLVSSGFVGAVILVRSAISPLIGYDTRFRWDFLAQRILAVGKFDFYPPIQAADFHTYFYVDGIPPLVSFTQWWLYASAGAYLPVLICLLVAAQFACTLVFTYGATAAIISRRAGIFAAALLAACPLFFRAVVLGQETGLTALSIAATLYFIVTARESDDRAAMISAGAAAALCALSREYGWIAVIAGLIALFWRRQALQQILIFAGVATALAAPWYIRNWALTGNPFYSLMVGSFPVNPIQAGILQQYNQLLGLSRWTGATWWSLVTALLTFATLQVVLGIPGGFTRFRRNGYLIVIALVLCAVWVQSVGYTSGGIVISMRVLSPVMVMLSITAAALLDQFAERAAWRKAMIGAIVVLQLWTAAHGIWYTDNPGAPLPPLSELSQRAFQSPEVGWEYRFSDRFTKIWPPGTRVLSDNAHLHASLIDKGVEVVPVWSPEVRFIFSLPAAEAEQRLRDLKIVNVAYFPQSLNTRYLVSASPFYAALPQRWRILNQIPNTMYMLIPKNQ